MWNGDALEFDNAVRSLEGDQKFQREYPKRAAIAKALGATRFPKLLMKFMMKARDVTGFKKACRTTLDFSAH